MISKSSEADVSLLGWGTLPVGSATTLALALMVSSSWSCSVEPAAACECKPYEVADGAGSEASQDSVDSDAPPQPRVFGCTREIRRETDERFPGSIIVRSPPNVSPLGCRVPGHVYVVDLACPEDPLRSDGGGIAPYAISEYPVGREDILACQKNGGCINDRITHLSYYSGQYCEWVGMRMCSDRELEIAARGWDSLLFPWGDAPADHCAGSRVGALEWARENDVSQYGLKGALLTAIAGKAYVQSGTDYSPWELLDYGFCYIKRHEEEPGDDFICDAESIRGGYVDLPLTFRRTTEVMDASPLGEKTFRCCYSIL